MRFASLPGIAALAAVALLIPSCSSEKKVERPNVVVITLDTVRADHLSCYGYDRPTTPSIDAIASGATRYSRAIATSSWTVPSHASLFTGRFPFEHGAHAYDVTEEAATNTNPLPEDELTLAEIFWDRGYATGAFVANSAFLNPAWQMNQGFETYTVDHAYGDQLNGKVFRWLDAVGKKPFFLFVNYIDAHWPYNTRPRPGVTESPVIRDTDLLEMLRDAVLPGEEPVPDLLAARVIEQYDTAIANVDAAVDELMQHLRRRGVYGRTIVVITSDHGEYFGEHRLVEHSKDIYQPGLMIPLIIKAPGQSEGEVDDQVVTLTDLPRLILDHFPDEWEDVRERFPDEPGNHDVIAELYYTRVKDLFNPRWGHRFNRIRTAYYDWPWKLIASSDGDNELYDLSEDPGELDNRYHADADRAASMQSALDEFIAERGRSDGPVDLPSLTEEERKRLESLGY